MFGKLSKNSSVKHILVVSLSNIGDIVLTCPVIDVLLRDFPLARISVIVGPKAETLFAHHPRIGCVVYDKHMPWFGQWQWFACLRTDSFDVIVDLRQSALGLFVPCRFRTTVFPQKFTGHMRQKHLQRLKTVYPDFVCPGQSQAIIPKLVAALGCVPGYVIIAPGAADYAKRWDPLGFVQVADHLADHGHTVVFVGDNHDAPIVEKIRQDMRHPSITLAGKTDLRELAFVLQNARLVLTHDSAALHFAGYFGVPAIALWGPTDVAKYGPWSPCSVIVRRGKEMRSITVKDVIDAIAQMP